MHQLDTLYNALNTTDQDSFNSAAGGNFLDKMPRECLKIIESKSKVRQSRSKAVIAKVSTSSSTLDVSSNVVELKDMVRALLLDTKNQAPAPATIKAIEQSCVTCGGAHSYQNYPAIDANLLELMLSKRSRKNTNILNGDFPVPTRIVKEVVQPVAPTTAEQKLARKNELKARGTLLMALPDKHQLNFNSHKDAKTLIEAIEKHFGGNTETKKVQRTLLKQHLPSEWKTHTLIWRNKTGLEDKSLDDLFNSIKIYESEVKHSSSIGTDSHNLAFVSSTPTDSTTDSVSDAVNVSAVGAKLIASTLLNRIDIDDLEEMDLKWQMAMLTMRAKRSLQRLCLIVTIIILQKVTVKVGHLPIKTTFQAATYVPASHKSHSSSKRRNRKAWGHHKQYAPLTHLKPQKHRVPTAVLPQYKPVSNTAVRPVSAALPNIIVTRPRYAHQVALVVIAVQGNISYLSNFEELNGGYVAFGGNPKGGKITVKGKIKTGKLDFDNVYFVKELKFNLFSVSQMCDKKNNVLFTDTECLVLSFDFKLPDESQVLLRVPRENNMYNVNLKNIVPSGDLTFLFAKATLDESNLWHRRLAHVNFKTINKLVKENLVRGLRTKVFENDHTCVACKKGKQHIASCKTKPVSRFTWVFFLATKDETTPILKTFLTGLENQLSLKVKVSKEVTSFAQSSELVKSHRHSDCDFHVRKLAHRTYASRDIHKQYAPVNHSKFPLHKVTTAAPPQSQSVLTTASRTVSAVKPIFSMTRPKLASRDVSKFKSPLRRYLPHRPSSNPSNSPPRVTAAKASAVSATQDKKGTWGNPQQALRDKGVINSGCSRHMTGNMSYLSDFEELNGGYVAFRGNPKGGKITRNDDIIFGATNKDLCRSFKKLMKDKFQMSSIGGLTFFLGLQVKKKKDGIFISQDKYVAEILRKFRLNEGKSVSTPIDTEKPLLKDPNGEDVDVHTYRSMIGSLMYLTSSRPDIMFVVCACVHFQVTPKASHLYVVKWIFRYLKGNPHLGLWYPKDSPFDLVAYSASDYAGAILDRKSTTGGCQLLGCRFISWQCKKQTVVATSSTEAEYVASAS
nr:hypothetical protein [Tanacetum cinerariifolium]